jgi:hypothetical protein
MVAFIDDHRAEYGVEPICRVLPIAPSTYFWHKAREADPTLCSARAQRDELLKREIRRVWDQNFQVCGWRRSGSSSTAKASWSPAARWPV